MIVMASIGAAVGSVVRFIIQTRFTARAEQTILGINWVAAFLAGVIYASQLPPMLNTLLMAGFVGGFSTFSVPIISLADALPDATKRWRTLGAVVILISGGVLLFKLAVLLMTNF